MKKTNKAKKLSVQLIVMIAAIFIVGTIASAVVLYRGSRDIYLEAKNDMISFDIKELKSRIEDYVCIDWMSEYMLKHDDYRAGYQTDDYIRITEVFPDYYSEDRNSQSFKEKLDSLEEKDQTIFARDQYTYLGNTLTGMLMNSKYEKIHCIDISPENCGFVFCDAAKLDVTDELSYKKATTGIKWDYSESDHPAIKKIRGKTDSKVEFEIASIDPDKDATSYIAYLPLGSGNVAVCISYDWAPFHTQLMHRVIILIAALTSAMILTCVFIMLFLKKVVVRPLRQMQHAVQDYTENKKCSEIVSKMYNIKTGSEIEYLADNISDLALEIDRYTKENIQIAGEKERAEKELYEAQVSIMVSQIQPHFMYNALSSIAMMCTIDPETAQEATVQFADYLRGNMDTLKRTAPVAFEVELEHLKKYLYIEKLRFGKKLNVVYDIQATDFTVPQLSIQPLVENAVKHGVGMKKKGGTVTISTKETDTTFEVIVSDDGVGFDTNAPKKGDGRSHVGMENTRKRLKDMCGADVITTSTIGEGTTVRVILPKEGQNNENTVL